MSILDDSKFTHGEYEASIRPNKPIKPQKLSTFPAAETLLWSGEGLILPIEWKSGWKTVPWVGLFWGLPLLGSIYLMMTHSSGASIEQLVFYGLAGCLIAALALFGTFAPVLILMFAQKTRCGADAERFYVQSHPKLAVKAYDWVALPDVEFGLVSELSMTLFYRYAHRAPKEDVVLLPKTLVYRLKGDATTFAALQALHQAAKTKAVAS